MHTISEQAGIAGRVIDLHGETWTEPRPSPGGGQAAALSATLSATCGCGSEACARFDRWAASLGGCAGVRYSALYQEAREMAGPDGAAEYLEMAQRIDEEHAAGRGRWFAEAAIELANAESAREAARQRVNEIRLTARYGWDDLAAVIELAARPEIVDLVGPKGYIHGWIFVGIPGPGQEVYHPGHGRGTVTGSKGGRVHVSFDSGHATSFPVRAHQGPGHFEQMTDDELAAEYNRSEGSHAKAVTDELDRRDQRDEDAATQAKAKRVGALYAEKPKTEAHRNRVYQSLVNEGENPEDAWAHAHGTNPEAMQKQSVIADLRAQGHKGAGFDALTRSAHKDDVRRRTVMAENATNGYMLSPKGKRAGIDPYSLFTGPESRARKYASPELKEWFDQNGRPTVADFQANLMGQKAVAGPRDFYASVTWDDPAAVVELSADPHLLDDLDFSARPAMGRAEVDAELRAALGLAARAPSVYESTLPPVGDLARMIGLKS